MGRPRRANAAPEGLSERSAALWGQLASRAKSIGRKTLLEEALRARDRAEELRGLLAGQPLVTTTERTGAVHLHPLVKAEAEARKLFAKLWGQLGLTWDVDIDA